VQKNLCAANVSADKENVKENEKRKQKKNTGGRKSEKIIKNGLSRK